MSDLEEAPGSGAYFMPGNAAGVTCPICAEAYVACDHTPAAMREHLLARLAQVPLNADAIAASFPPRTDCPIVTGLLAYFPNACAYVSHVSKRANDQHNPGEEMHWAFDKSVGKGDQIARHLTEAGTLDMDGLRHSGKVAWRALELLERELLKAHPELKPGANVKGYSK